MVVTSKMNMLPMYVVVEEQSKEFVHVDMNKLKFSRLPRLTGTKKTALDAFILVTKALAARARHIQCMSKTLADVRAGKDIWRDEEEYLQRRLDEYEAMVFHVVEVSFEVI